MMLGANGKYMDYNDLLPEQLVDLLSDKQQRNAVIVALVGGITAQELRHVTVSPAVKTALVRGLQHPNGLVRWWCIQLMDHLAEESYIEPLLASAHNDPLPKNRRHAIHALTCELCKPDRCKLDIDLRYELATFVVNDGDWSVKIFALQELVEIVGPDAIWGYLQALPGSEQATLRSWLHTEQARTSLQVAIACARGVPGWRGQLASRILKAADQLLQAALNSLAQCDLNIAKDNLNLAQHLAEALHNEMRDGVTSA